MEQEDKNIPENEVETQQVSEAQEVVVNADEAKAEEKAEVKVEAKEDSRGSEGRPGSRPQKRSFGKKGSDNKKPAEVESEYIEKVLDIRRVTKVTKGGKRMSFSVLVVVGDGKSNVGYAQEKASEVATAIRKAIALAKKNMVKISLKGTTIPHEIIGVFGGARVLLKPAAEGTGVIASGPVRAVCDGAGIHNILTKSHRSNNPVNVVKATLKGLQNLKTEKN